MCKETVNELFSLVLRIINIFYGNLTQFRDIYFFLLSSSNHSSYIASLIFSLILLLSSLPFSPDSPSQFFFIFLRIFPLTSLSQFSLRILPNSPVDHFLLLSLLSPYVTHRASFPARGMPLDHEERKRIYFRFLSYNVS